ncbi:synaptic vesicle glycoprotein 2C [Amyelois transitella]|uniref:synaptic vesicle glycoprotein 2C n=1 Tax=Amyelois transitella TaxID=680683 RepID=UPI00298FB23C|nr:synaptic vesicle glycoprotein 2C [Amyelois transitella]
MEQKNINTLSENIDKSDENSADLDQALAVVGMGWYNIKYSLVLALFLIASIVEPMGYSFVLPAAKCDLDMTDAQRGIISSVPYLGIVVTSFPWGYLVDTRGRKRMIIFSSLAAGLFGVVSAFMPELVSFTIFKTITALCIACPAAVPYTFIGEMLPLRHRDITLSITNAMQIFGSTLVPVLGFGILPLNFRSNFGAYDFRPWRLLCILYSCTFFIAAFLMSFGPESPKYLLSQGKYDEALKVLQNMYAGNKGKSPEDFPIKKLKVPPASTEEKLSFLQSLKIQSVPLLRRPYLKWMALNGFLLFGVFSILNGLYMWVPDVLNRVLTGDSEGLTACGVIAQGLNQTIEETKCDDSIDTMTFVINSIATVSCAFIALAVSITVKFIGKKVLLILVFLVIGIFCVLINHVTQDMVFAVLLSSIPLTALAIGPVNASSVGIFPTHLRGMAVSLTMMVGRCGSIVGTNVAGVMINAACEATFYMFGGLLLVCSVASLLVPKAKTEPPTINEKVTRL